MSSRSSFVLKRVKKSKSICARLRNRELYGDKIRSITEVPREVLTSNETEDESKNSTTDSNSGRKREEVILSAAHEQFIDILRILTDLSSQYSLENYLIADYDLLNDCMNGLDDVICTLQEEAGWLTAVRTLTSLSATTAIASHIYKPVYLYKIGELPDSYFAFAKRALGVFHFITGHNSNIARHFGSNKHFLKALFDLIPERR